MAAEWFYTHGMGQQRLGPVDKEKLKQLAAEGGLSRQDLVWTVGMPQWAEAGSVAGLFDGVGAPVASAVAASSAPVPSAMAAPSAPATVDYRNARVAATPVGMPPRALAALQGHARPEGEMFDWPLDDAHVAQWDRTVQLRKKVSAAAQLYRALLFLSAIGAAVLVMVWVYYVLLSGSARMRTEMMPMIIPAAIAIGFSALYYAAWRGTTRSRRWAPLTMFIVFLIAAVMQIGGVFLTPMNRVGDQISAVIGVIFVIVIFGAFVVVSWRAYATIPLYLMQPAWCQELIVKAQL